MKKTVKIISAICAIVMLIGLLPIMSVSAEDAETATLVVEPSADKVAAGKTFTLTVSIKNNPGIWGIKFDMDIDTTAFEGVSYDFSTSILADGAGVSGFSAEGDSFTCNRTSNDILNNTTDDGIVVVITLRAKAAADFKSYTFNAVVDDKNTIGCDQEKVAVASASGNVELVERSIDSASVLLGTDISVKYYATLGADDTAAQMKFTFNGQETVVDGVATGNGKEYSFLFDGIAPQCMGDNLKAELIVGGNVVAEKATYSVLENCNNLLASGAAVLGLSDGEYAAMETLIADLLVYGAKAQLFKSYKTNALVDANVTGATELGDVPAAEDVFYTEVSTSDTVAMTAVGVFFDYANSIFFKFTAPEAEADSITLVYGTYNNRGKPVTIGEYVVGDCKLIDAATSTYAFYTPAMSFYDYANAFYLELLVDGETVQYVDYSVNSYAFAMQDNANTEMADLAKALYNYGASAAAFLDLVEA